MKKIKNLLSTTAGFTLIELMIVIVVLGILAGIAIPRITGIREDARVNSVKSELKNVQTALEMYAVDNNQYPSQSTAGDIDSIKSDLDISDNGLTGPNGNPYYYQTKNSDKQYAVWYVYTNEDGDNSRIMITSEAGMSTTTTTGTYSTDSTPSGF